MWNHPARMALSTLGIIAVAVTWCPAQEPEQKTEPGPTASPPRVAAAPLPVPPPVPPLKLDPVLATTPVRRGQQGPNVQMVDASLLPRDKQGIWVLNFAFKPMRMRTVDIPGKGRRQVHYLYYRVVNRTGQPREFVPQFTVITDSKRRFEESVIPKAVPLIQNREDPTIKVLGAVDVAGVLPPSTKQTVDDAVFGVALWDGIDPNADRMSIYVRGLSDGYQDGSSADGGKPVTKYKTLRIDLIRRGDARNLNEKEITLAEPPYEWVYW